MDYPTGQMSHTEMALALVLVWMVWLLGTTPAETTNVVERTSTQVVARRGRAIIVGACRSVVDVVSWPLHAVLALLQA